MGGETSTGSNFEPLYSPNERKWHYIGWKEEFLVLNQRYEALLSKQAMKRNTDPDGR